MDSGPQKNTNWQAILDDVFNDNTEQLGRLCQDYLRPKIYPFALSLVNNHAEAEDVVQGVFERLLTHYHGIRSRELKGFDAFVMAMVKNACREVWKKRKPTEPVSDDLTTTHTAHTHMVRQQVVAHISDAVQQKFTRSEQRLFELKVIQELTYRDIEQQTGVAIGTLHGQYTKIVKKLDARGELRAYWEEIKARRT